MKLEESRWYKNATLKVLRIVLLKVFAIIGLINAQILDMQWDFSCFSPLSQTEFHLFQGDLDTCARFFSSKLKVHFQILSINDFLNFIFQGEKEPFIRNVLTLDTCAPIIGSDVISCDKETLLLERWAEFVREVDPDIITGYNINNFDAPYLINRATHLHVRNFQFLGNLLFTKFSKSFQGIACTAY